MGFLCVRRVGWPAKLRLGWAVPAGALAVLGLSQPLARDIFAQDAMGNAAAAARMNRYHVG
jgi:hypothetical protein